MGSSTHPEEYQKLSRQIDAINKLPFLAGPHRVVRVEC